MKNLAIFVFSFTCHQNVFSISNELKMPSKRRIDTVIAAAIGSALILYMVVAIEGYRTFGNNVKGDILLNYPQNGLVTMMRIGISIMVIFSYPLQLDPSRRCLTSLVHAVRDLRDKKRQGEEALQEQQTQGEVDELAEDMFERLQEDENENAIKEFVDSLLFNGITCLFLVLSFTIAMMVSDLGIILGVVGATGSTMVSYILPGAIYIKLHPHKHFLRSLAHLQLIMGVLIIPTALYFVVFKGAVG